jgi:hypothetical protein
LLIEGRRSSLVVMREVDFPALLAGAMGLALLAAGIVYLTVPCEDLPGFMGSTQGDTSPRTGLGIAGVLLGVAALVVARRVARRSAPPHS